MTQKSGYLGQKVNFFYGNRDFCQQCISQVYPGLQLSHSDHPKKISISKLGIIFRGSPLFLAPLGHSHDRGISTLNFGPFSTKLGGIVRAIKKITQNDNGHGPGRNYGETAVFTFGRKVFFWPKMGFNTKIHPKFLKRLMFIWEKATLFFEQFFPVVARTWFPLRSGFFLGPQTSGFGPKIRFLPHDPNFGQCLVCSPRSDRSFPTLGTIF